MTSWPVADAMLIADAAVVLAVNEDNEPCLYLLDLDQEAVHHRQLESVDPSRGQGGGWNFLAQRLRV